MVSRGEDSEGTQPLDGSAMAIAWLIFPDFICSKHSEKVAVEQVFPHSDRRADHQLWDNFQQ
jgi:hypothetical protein